MVAAGVAIVDERVHEGSAWVFLTAQTTVDTLLQDYPFLDEFLHAYGHVTAADAAPDTRRKVGRMVDLEYLARAAGVSLPVFLGAVRAEVRRVTGETPTWPVAEEALRDGHRPGGETLARVVDEPAGEHLGAQRVGAFVTREGAEVVAPLGHPVHTLSAELQAIARVAAGLRVQVDRLGVPADRAVWLHLRAQVRRSLIDLAEVEKHLRRVENLVLPLLTASGSAVAHLVEDDHGRVRDRLEHAAAAVLAERPRAVPGLCARLLAVLDALIYKEQHILLPLAMARISRQQWLVVRAAEQEYGWTLIGEPSSWPGSGSTLRRPPSISTNGGSMSTIPLASGTLSAAELSLVLMQLPLDLMFIDADGVIVYFSGSQRVLAAKPTLLGRRLQDCQAADDGVGAGVQRVLDALRAGIRDEVEFWRPVRGRCVVTRYAALRDDSGIFRGVLQTNQDVSALRLLAPRGFFDAPRPDSAVRGVSPLTDGVHAAADELALDYGALTVAQLDLLIAALPVDFSVADEHDTLLQFAGTVYATCDRNEIGGSLQACHPAGSQAALARVLAAFRAGRDEPFEELVEGRSGGWHYVAYLPLRHSDGVYRGILEVQQDVTGIRALTGEFRLSDWQAETAGWPAAPEPA
ncbi:MAG: PAS domain-containing protein [Thermoleophilia bacterium]